MTVTITTANIFTSPRQTLVNTVNCEGVMGKGIALAHGLRQPAMYERYRDICARGLLQPGKLWLYHPPPEAPDNRLVLNFPTKRKWRQPTRMGDLEAGLEKFVSECSERGVESVAFPLLGAANGGLSECISLDVMVKWLDDCPIPVDIHRAGEDEPDDLIDGLRLTFAKWPVADVAMAIGIGVDTAHDIEKQIDPKTGRVNSLSRLAECKGIGTKTQERLFAFAMRHCRNGSRWDGPAHGDGLFNPTNEATPLHSA